MEKGRVASSDARGRDGALTFMKWIHVQHGRQHAVRLPPRGSPSEIAIFRILVTAHMCPIIVRIIFSEAAVSLLHRAKGLQPKFVAAH